MRKIGETTYKETAFGIIPRSKLVLLEIEGIKKSWDFILQQKEKNQFDLNSDFLKKIHRIGFAWIFPDLCGNFRTIDVSVSNHKPPKHYLVQQLIYEFCSDLNVRIDNLPSISNIKFLDELVILLAWAHHKFLWIHPFVDYNGRIARLLINLILLKINLPPIELKVETKVGRLKYIEALQLADTGNFSKLESLVKKAIEESIIKLQ